MTIDIIGLISFIIFLVIFLVIAYVAMSFGLNNRKLSKEILQLKLDKLTLLEKLESEIEKNQSHTLENTDGFVRFLSDSRDWAFDYIEKVQSSIQKLKTSVESGYDTEEELKNVFGFLPNNEENKNG